jgi:L-seryl-tRNA(Ser) seleniumtransferase
MALRALPSVHELLEQDRGKQLVAQHGRGLVRSAIQQALESERSSAEARGEQERWSAVESTLETLRQPQLRRVINATGVILHTNLGRAPLSRAAIEEVVRVAAGYSNLEYDLQEGRRGSRHELLSRMLARLTGAEAAAVVNNGAAATLLMLTGLTRGKEVIVSRGELVEIGGGFRMPDIMRLSGARMVEVGTTNRTHLSDYERAITPKTAAILKVHPSNFRLSGFAESVSVKELSPVAREHQLHLLYDLGGGALLDTSAFGLAHEPTIQEALEDGVDLLSCSGDKLIGGPQAGLLLGRSSLIGRVLKHPLARAVRVDKLTLAAMAATLDAYLSSNSDSLPLWSMVASTADDIRERAAAMADRLQDFAVVCELCPGSSTIGGGSLPGEVLPTTLLSLRPKKLSSTRLAERLRKGEPPVIGRLDSGALLLDLRTVLVGETDALLAALQRALL